MSEVTWGQRASYDRLAKEYLEDDLNVTPPPVDSVNHPKHYGGESDPYECIKVIEAWGLGFHLGSVLKYIRRSGEKSLDGVEDLEKGLWYLEREIARRRAP